MDIFLYKDGDILSRCNAVYIGLLGMQVDANPLLLPKFTAIDAMLYFDVEGNTSRCKLNSVVTSRSSQGVGLTFVNCNENTRYKLKKLILYINNHSARNVAPLCLENI